MSLSSDPRSGRLEGFVACAPGIEPLLARELRALDLEAIEPEAGGARFRTDFAGLARLHLEVGVALDAWIHVARFQARHFRQLERHAKAVPWPDLLPADARPVVRAHCRRSKLYHSTAVAQRVRGAIEAAGLAAGGGAEIEVRARFVDDVGELSIGTAGEALHRRGYRLETSKAPLREDLARAALLAAGWPELGGTLVDATCGSGTLLIEGALLDADRAPGLGRAFTAEALPFVPGDAFTEARERALDAVRAGQARIRGSDRDAGAVAIAGRNAERAGVRLELDVAPLSAAPFLDDPGDAGLWIGNPPHGGRVSAGKDLRALHQTLGARFRALPGGWRLALVVADRRLAAATGVPMTHRFTADHGGRKIHLLTSS